MKRTSGMRMHPGLTLAVAGVAAMLGLGLVGVSMAGAEVIGPAVTLGLSIGETQIDVPLVMTCTENGTSIDYCLQGPYSVMDGLDGVVATIDGLSVKFEEDPVVDLSFSVVAGNLPTTFTFTSAVLAFPTVTNPFAFASAGVTLTDGDPLSVPGASMSIVPPRTGLYRATYNGGTIFSELLPTQILPPGGGTMNASANSGIQTILGSVSSIQSSFSFTLSARDLASGTSRFEVTPEPSTFVLMACGLAALLLLWRRR